MEINKLFINQDSLIKKSILIDNIKCQLIYIDSLLGKKPSEVYSLFNEDFIVAYLYIDEYKYFKVYCEEYTFDKENKVHFFEVYAYIDDEEYERSEFVPEKIYSPIESEAELINYIKDLMSRVYFR